MQQSRLTRATGFASIKSYHKVARSEIALLIQVETLQALDAIKEIVKVPSVDGIFVGAADLAAAMGRAGEVGHSEAKAVGATEIYDSA